MIPARGHLYVDEVAVKVTDAQTRIPFRYGIVEMTHTKHVIVQLRLRDGSGRAHVGQSAENMPPKWFTKDPSSSIEEDEAAMRRVILAAARLATQVSAATPFEWWAQLHAMQSVWGASAGVPQLLSGLGTSLLERAMIDAYCRAHLVSFGDALRNDMFGIDLPAFHPELRGLRAADLLPTNSNRCLTIRHTVGLADQLTRTEPTLRDGLPENTEDAVVSYGLRHLKVKVSGKPHADAERLRELIKLSDRLDTRFRITLDGNENFHEPDAFLAWWGLLNRSSRTRAFLHHSVFAIEQPLHRDMAMTSAAARLFTPNSGLPPVIIDESDAEPASIREAMDLGYAGGTYKGCKGVFRGVMNACLVNFRGRHSRSLLTAEDLATLPPITLLQDFAVVAALGLPDIERNGHYYFGRFAPTGVHDEHRAQVAHSDVFRLDSAGRVQVRITNGSVAIGSVIAAPFGCLPVLDVDALDELAD